MPSLGFFTIDVIILIAITALIFFFSFSRPKIVVKALISIYVTILVFANIPYLSGQGPAILIGAFAVLFLATLFLLRQSLRIKKGGSGNKFIMGLLLTVAGLIMLAVLYYNVLPISSLYSISLPIEPFFTDKVPLGVWYFVPVIVIFLASRDGN